MAILKRTESNATKAVKAANANKTGSGFAPSSRPGVITRSGNNVFKDGKLVGSYNNAEAANKAVAEFTGASSTGRISNIQGDSQGQTFRQLRRVDAGTQTGQANTAGIKQAMKSRGFIPETYQDTAGNERIVGAQTPASLTKATAGQRRDLTPSNVPVGTQQNISLIAPITPRPIINKGEQTYYGQTVQPYDVSAVSATQAEGNAATTQGAGGPYLSDAPMAPMSLQEIRQEQLRQAENSINAVEGVFNDEIARLSQQGERNLAQTSAYAVGAGLAGSPFQSSMERDQQYQTDLQIRQVQNQRAVEIASIYQTAEANAQNLYQSALDNYRQDLNLYIDERDKELAAKNAEEKAKKDAATNLISTLATSGYSLDELPKAQYQQLLQDSGMSDFEAKAIWASKIPAANAQYSVQNGFLVGTYFDPATGKPVVTTTKLPAELVEATAPDIKNISLADGSVVFYDANSPFNVDGSLRTINYKGSEIKNTDTGTDLPTSYEEWSLAGGIEGTGQTYAQWIGKNTEDRALSVDEAEKLGVPIGTTERQAIEMGLMPSTTPTLSTEDVRKTTEAKKLQGINTLNEAINEYYKLIKEYGAASGLTPGARDLLDGAKTKAILAIKDAETLGALQAPDIAIIEGLVPDVTVEGFFSSLIPRPRMAKNALNLLEQTLRQYKETAQTNYDSLISSGASPSDPFLIEIANKLGIERAQASSEDDVDQFLDSFSNDLSTSQKGSQNSNTVAIQTLASVARPGQAGGQCGRFVNKYTGLGVRDSFESKMNKTDPSIKVGQPGDVFVMPYSWTGHIGFIQEVRPRNDGTYDYVVLDSNYGLDEKIKRHVLNSKKISGYARVPIKITA